MPGMVRPVQAQPHAAAPERIPFSSGPYAETRAPKKEKRPFSLEETLGRNWFPKVGIALIVIGMAFLMRVVWGNIPVGGRVAIIYAVALGTLAGGIFLERKERYRNLGRALIGGGWAITFAISYAITHVQAVQVLPSRPVDLFLLLTVAVAMVWHTLKYNSQTVTGIAFLLGFVSVTLNPDPPYNLIAAAVLVSGLTVIVLRRQWYELEVFGILASYLNHFYWIYQIYQGLQPFPQYRSSVALMIAYWAIFRTSYLLRKIANKQQESVSTVAGLLSPLLFLGVMAYQSFHPEWRFWALLVMGAVEFTLGQLPVARRRLTPFQILSSLGATLMVVAVPSRYAGHHSLELLWMAGAEAFLLAGIFTRERLFRQFAGIISLLVAAYLFTPFSGGILSELVALRNGAIPHDAALGLSLAVVAALFYVNSHIICRIWRELFDRGIEKQAVALFSYIAGLFVVASIYSLAQYDTVAVILAIFVTALAWTSRQFRITELRFQAHWIAAVSVLDVCITGIHLDASWHSIPERLITFSLVAALLYLSAVLIRDDAPSTETRLALSEISVVVYRWFATGLITLLIWLQVWFSPVRRDWRISVLWTAFALALAGVAQWSKRKEFNWQAFVLAMMSFGCTLAVNFGYDEQFHHLSYRLISVCLVAAGIYLLARWSPVISLRPAYTWAGTILLGYLAFKETQTQQPWTAVLWVGMAVILGLAARFWKDRALHWQTHLLAAAAVIWTLAITFQSYRDSHEHMMTMLTTVLISSGLLYLLTWITDLTAFAESKAIRPAYSWAATILLGILVYCQTQEKQALWTAVLWIGMAAILAVAARFWKDRSLLWQTHLLAAAATGWTILCYLSRIELNHTPTQAITVLITVAVLYALTWLTRGSQLTENDRIWQAYSWAGSLLLSWLGWYQLQPISLSLAWGIFGLALFEIGYNARSAYLRAQAYVALVSSFAHLFYTNFATPLAAGGFDPRILLIVFLVPMYFWTFWRLHIKTDIAGRAESKLRIEYLVACLGTATIAALAYFEMPLEAVVAGYAAIVLALLVVTWWKRLDIFLYQMLVMLGITAVRLWMRNFNDLRHSFIMSALPGSLWAIGLLAAGIPIALQLRSKEEQASTTKKWITFLVRRPEQPLFFVTVILMSVLLAIKLPDMITLALGIEGVVVFLLALAARQRSFRLTGFALVVICVAKIAGWDAWRMNDPRARYLTFIGVGVVILLVSYLYARYREALREYL